MADPLMETPAAERPEAPRGLRPLGLPRPLHVRADGRGEPAALAWPSRGGSGGRMHPVEQVQEVWRIAEEWWRGEPLARTYYRVVLQDGRPLTLFHDDLAPQPEEGWYEQRY